ncbi:hypothetical protein [Paenibacillus sp. GbtcB18]|uniref:hypothetical protein n=1 Tax=Paenibacillus sp. GbtcB18 TaxID=2824763 RepID=UPI001C30A17B|nr:hypothetical protein [Paenibacillus sp. GbtcB18]
MKKIALNLFLVLSLLLALPLSAFADEPEKDSQNVTGEFKLVEGEKKESEQGETEKPAFVEHFKLVEKDENGLISPAAEIGGYGTIFCYDGGKVMECKVNFYLTGGAQIKGVDGRVVTYDSNKRQYGEEKIEVWFSYGTLFSKYQTTTFEHGVVPGVYTAKVYGALTGISGKTDNMTIYYIVPITSAEVTIK